MHRSTESQELLQSAQDSHTLHGIGGGEKARSITHKKIYSDLYRLLYLQAEIYVLD